MVQLTKPSLAICGLLAAPLFGGGAVSASRPPALLEHRASQVTPSPTSPPSSETTSVTAISGCHLHGGSTVECTAGSVEYVVHTTATATADIPPSFTGCYVHDAQTICLAPNGAEVVVSLASAEDEHDDHDHDNHDHEEESSEQISSTGQNCHYHAGVEHCESDAANKATTQNCELVHRDYNIKLRVGLLFVMLVTSAIGVFGPILMASFVAPRNIIFTILRQFGTGVVISTAFIHLFTHANLMFENECLGELAYESTASAILMAGIFVSFLVEYAGVRLMQWHGAKKACSSSAESPAALESPLLVAARAEIINISVLEAGVLFHSLLIGVTLVVSGDSFFLTLFAVIVFHQMFEGIALGTRLAALGQPGAAVALASHGHHNHGHGHDGHSHSHSHSHFQELKTKPDQPPSPVSSSGVNSSGILGERPSILGMRDIDGSSGSGGEGEGEFETGSTIVAAVPISVSIRKKLALAAAFALVTPIGMAIGIGVLHQFNGNDPSTIIAIGTLDALSAGILVWVGVVEMWSHDWMNGGEMATASPIRTVLGLLGLVVGMALMSLLGKWA
ncbi:hypothetical protein B0H63DRAFT_387792 [Podospora didyma]|uniref:Zinc-regulated transporter n=1 Tax=Podospora didyma TaxID=330526 RepID=A0AAE0MZL5_9PEZI|nr:hypothetical protein B0H63DRAFT_530030 [Podospora didyma]KAK3392763.1 hypothetical protein B0H63DRAFT_387792 [Podospora didyma]